MSTEVPDNWVAHLDYGGDGFAERTGWVKGDDSILVFDRNWRSPDRSPSGQLKVHERAGPGCSAGNRRANAIKLGSATQDGFEVLETLDTNNDGKITLVARLRHDAADAEFASLRVWQDANEDGISDTGELKTLAELGIQSISVNRTDVTGTNQGHDRGFAATFTRALSHRAFSCPPATGAGSTGTAETIYFQTDRADTVDPTPGFTPAEGVDKFPQLQGAGNFTSHRLHAGEA